LRPVYLLDTNVVSEAIRPSPDVRVMERMREYDGLTVIAAVVWHELLFGMSRLPDGYRKRRIRTYLYDVAAASFPVIPYDDSAAAMHAEMRADAERGGTPLSFADGMIASIARTNNLLLVTRNTADFSAIPGLYLEDWFAGGES
jgi:tRNA(fMet)-specific endonuclease VapC